MTLSTSHLTIGYRSHPVLADIDLSTQPGKLTVLLGGNGSGKSTLLRTLTGAQPPLGGHVLLDGIDVTTLDATARARRMAVVFTDRTGGGGLTVEELVAIGRHAYTGLFGRLADVDRQAIERAIERVGLGDKRRRCVASLSDGERQKAMIARAVAQDTGIIVLDEPTSFLDVAARFEIMGLLSSIAAGGTTVLLSTHDTAPALAVAHDVWAIADGRIHAAPVGDIIASGILDHVYDGVCFDAATRDFRPC